MPGKILVRQHVKVTGWSVPDLPINLISKYLEACEAHGATANTGVVAQLLLRTRMLQPLPYHRVSGLDRASLIEALWQHLDVAKNGLVPSARLKEACLTINPRLPWEDFGLHLSFSQPLPDEKGDPVELHGTGALLPDPDLPFVLPQRISQEQFLEGVTAAAEGVDDADLQQGVLELLAFQVDVEQTGRRGLFTAAFKEMDIGDQGSITADELRLLAATLSHVGMTDEMPAEHPALHKPRFTQVTLEEYLGVMESVCKDVSDKDLEIAVYEMLSFNVRPPWEYDFSRNYLGAAGIRPLMDALDYDPAFTGLRLSGCGVSNDGSRQLANWLSKRSGIRRLDLSHNPISNSGAVALAALLRANKSISDLGLAGCDVLRPWSRTHTRQLGPASCEDGAPVAAALDANRSARVDSSSEVVATLRQHGPDLKALVYSMADKNGKAPLQDLQAALRDIVGQWGFTPAAADAVISSERLLGAAAQSAADATGQLRVSYSEFMLFLRSQMRVSAVAAAVRHNRLTVKVEFYKILRQDSNMVAIGEFKQHLQQLVCVPGSGWGISQQDLEEVLVPNVFRRNGGIEVPNERTEDKDLLLSWPSFFNTLMFMYNAC